MSEEANFETDLEALKQWFIENPDLPEEIDSLLLRRFFKSENGNVESTKKMIEINYSMRSKNPKMFIERDPDDEDVLIARASIDSVALPGLTPERYKVFLFRMSESLPKVVNHLGNCKQFHMLADCRFTLPDIEDSIDEAHSLAEGDVVIIDMKNYSFALSVSSFNATNRVNMKFMQDAFPTLMRAMHVINCPTYLDKMIALAKAFVKSEVLQVTHFHSKGLESLFEYVPKDMMPDEYGGNAGTVADLKAAWIKMLYEKRDYLKDPKKWVVQQVSTSVPDAPNVNYLEQ